MIAVEKSSAYDIANIGFRPLNLSPRDVLRLLPPTQHSAILMLKPDAFERFIDSTPLSKVIEGLVTSAGLDVLCVSRRRLNAGHVYRLYEKVLCPNPTDDLVYGTLWKRNVINHITSDYIQAFLLEGKGAQQRSSVVKNCLRRRLCSESEESKIIKNIAHVPDADEFNESLRILFL